MKSRFEERDDAAPYLLVIGKPVNEKHGGTAGESAGPDIQMDTGRGNRLSVHDASFRVGGLPNEEKISVNG
jgi:hypothetical protein